MPRQTTAVRRYVFRKTRIFVSHLLDLLLVCQQLSDRNCTILRIFQSVLTIKFWHRHFQKGYLKSTSKLLEKIVKFERKMEIIPPENIEKITQFSGRETAIIGHQGIRASKRALEELKLWYPNTTAFVLGKYVNFLIVCYFTPSYFAIYYDAPSPGEIDTIFRCAENAIQSYSVW